MKTDELIRLIVVQPISIGLAWRALLRSIGIDNVQVQYYFKPNAVILKR